MGRTNDPCRGGDSCRKGDPVLITLAARAGAMAKHDLAFWWCLLYHSEKGELPVGTAIASGVRRRFGKRISQAAAYRGLAVARETLMFAESSMFAENENIVLRPPGQTARLAA